MNLLRYLWTSPSLNQRGDPHQNNLRYLTEVLLVIYDSHCVKNKDYQYK